jgi:hypothetical protein
MSKLKLFIKFIMRTAYFSKCPKCQTYTVFVFVTYTHRRVFHLSLSRLLSDYFTVGLITGRYTLTYFLSIKFQQILVFRISEDGSEASAVRVAYLFTSNIVCDISEIKRSLYFVTHLSIK